MEHERGLSGSIHETLAYQFGDERVAAVQSLLNEFQRRMGNRWYRLAFDLLDGIPALEIAIRSGNGHYSVAGVALESQLHGPNDRAIAQLKLEFFALTRIPYSLLRSALNASAADAPIPSETLLARAEGELSAIERQVRDLRQRVVV